MFGKCKALLAAIVLASLTACGSGAASAPPKPTATPDAKATGDAAFNYNLDHRHLAGSGFFVAFPKPQRKQLALAVCQHLKGGDSVMKVDADLLSAGIPKAEPAENVGAFVSAAVVAYCPDQEAKLAAG